MTGHNSEAHGGHKVVGEVMKVSRKGVISYRGLKAEEEREEQSRRGSRPAGRGCRRAGSVWEPTAGQSRRHGGCLQGMGSRWGFSAENSTITWGVLEASLC